MSGEKTPENSEIVEFPKSEPFNWKFRDESQIEWKLTRKHIGNLGIPQEILLFFENYVTSKASSFGREIPSKNDGDVYSKTD